MYRAASQYYAHATCARSISLTLIFSYLSLSLRARILYISRALHSALLLLILSPGALFPPLCDSGPFIALAALPLRIITVIYARTCASSGRATAVKRHNKHSFTTLRPRPVRYARLLEATHFFTADPALATAKGRKHSLLPCAYVSTIPNHLRTVFLPNNVTPSVLSSRHDRRVLVPSLCRRILEIHGLPFYERR